MKSLSLLVSVLALSIAFTDHTAAQAETKPTRILLIGKEPDHPYGSHMYMHTSGVLAKCLEQTEGVETVVSQGWPTEAKTLEGVRTIVVYSSPAAEFLLDGPGAAKLNQMMNDGVGLVTIHWASSVYEANLDRLGDRWGDYLGGFWVSNYGLSTDKSQLKQLVPDHPICRGWKEYELHDEYYLKPTIKEATRRCCRCQRKVRTLSLAGHTSDRTEDELTARLWDTFTVTFRSNRFGNPL